MYIVPSTNKQVTLQYSIAKLTEPNALILHKTYIEERYIVMWLEGTITWEHYYIKQQRQNSLVQ